MSVKDYIKEFHNLDIRSRHIDDEVKNVPRYPNGMRTSIQDEINFMKIESMEEVYLYALRANEILEKEKEHNVQSNSLILLIPYCYICISLNFIQHFFNNF